MAFRGQEIKVECPFSGVQRSGNKGRVPLQWRSELRRYRSSAPLVAFRAQEIQVERPFSGVQRSGDKGRVPL